MTGWLETLLLTAFMSGLLGGMHCAAMCGGIACFLNGDQRARAAPRWNYTLTYNAGRILCYTLAGALAGAAGQAGLLFRGWLPLQQMFMTAAGLMLVLMALYLAGVSPLIRGLEAAGTVVWRHMQPLAQRVLPVNSVAKAFGLGVVWGWLPCGMVYAVLLLALSTGNPALGAWVMLAFGLGTLPNMLLISGAAHRLRGALKCRGARWAVATVIAGAGVYGMFHALHPAAIDVGGFFCRIAPEWFGR